MRRFLFAVAALKTNAGQGKTVTETQLFALILLAFLPMILLIAWFRWVWRQTLDSPGGVLLKMWRWRMVIVNPHASDSEAANEILNINAHMDEITAEILDIDRQTIELTRLRSFMPSFFTQQQILSDAIKSKAADTTEVFRTRDSLTLLKARWETMNSMLPVREEIISKFLAIQNEIAAEEQQVIRRSKPGPKPKSYRSMEDVLALYSAWQAASGTVTAERFATDNNISKSQMYRLFKQYGLKSETNSGLS